MQRERVERYPTLTPTERNQEFAQYWELLPDSGKAYLLAISEQRGSIADDVDFQVRQASDFISQKRVWGWKKRFEQAMADIGERNAQRLYTDYYILWAAGLQALLRQTEKTIPDTFRQIIVDHLLELVIIGVDKTESPQEKFYLRKIAWVLDHEGGIFDPQRAEGLSTRGIHQLETTYYCYNNLYQEMYGPGFRQRIQPRPHFGIFNVDAIGNRVRQWRDEHKVLYSVPAEPLGEIDLVSPVIFFLPHK